MHNRKSNQPKQTGPAALTGIKRIAEKKLLGTILFAIQGYRLLISPFLGSRCRFYPSCSAYAEQALRGKGLWQGALLAVKRLLKCQPFHPGGIDVVETGA